MKKLNTNSKAGTVFLPFIIFQAKKKKRKRENIFFFLLPTQARSSFILWVLLSDLNLSRRLCHWKGFHYSTSSLIHPLNFWTSFLCSPPFFCQESAVLLWSDLVKDYFEPIHSWCNSPLCCSQWQQDPCILFKKRQKQPWDVLQYKRLLITSFFHFKVWRSFIFYVYFPSRKFLLSGGLYCKFPNFYYEIDRYQLNRTQH